jgi:hypothetical protein
MKWVLQAYFVYFFVQWAIAEKIDKIRLYFN